MKAKTALCYIAIAAVAALDVLFFVFVHRLVPTEIISTP